MHSAAVFVPAESIYIVIVTSRAYFDINFTWNGLSTVTFTIEVPCPEWNLFMKSKPLKMICFSSFMLLGNSGCFIHSCEKNSHKLLLFMYKFLGKTLDHVKFFHNFTKRYLLYFYNKQADRIYEIKGLPCWWWWWRQSLGNILKCIRHRDRERERCGGSQSIALRTHLNAF